MQHFHQKPQFIIQKHLRCPEMFAGCWSHVGRAVLGAANPSLSEVRDSELRWTLHPSRSYRHTAKTKFAKAAFLVSEFHKMSLVEPRRARPWPFQSSLPHLCCCFLAESPRCSLSVTVVGFFPLILWEKKTIIPSPSPFKGAIFIWSKLVTCRDGKSTNKLNFSWSKILIKVSQ